MKTVNKTADRRSDLINTHAQKLMVQAHELARELNRTEPGIVAAEMTFTILMTVAFGWALTITMNIGQPDLADKLIKAELERLAALPRRHAEVHSDGSVSPFQRMN